MTVSGAQVVRTVLTAVLGMALGFFVVVSVIADGPWDERRLTIGAILLGYGLAGAALGFRAAAWYGLGLALPGLAVLALLAAGGEGGWRFLLYGTLILVLAESGAYGTSITRSGRRPSGEGDLVIAAGQPGGRHDARSRDQ